jgi:N-acetylmuramoyl-L-alanine amidase
MLDILASRWTGSARHGLPCVGLIVFLGCFSFLLAPDDNLVPGPNGTTAEEVHRAELAAGPPTVVIDPGHGGIDDGTKYFGLAEKDLTLDVAERLEPLLKAAGVETVMTRRDDVYVSLPRRAEIANQVAETNGNVIYVSIHFNQSSVEYVDGIETYYADRKIPSGPDWKWEGFFSQPEGQGPDDVLEKGANLAADIQGSLTARMMLTNRGIKGRSLFVVRHTVMPAVLVEGAFLSNKVENQMLRDAAYRDRIAEGIAAGIMTYVQTMRPAIPTHLAGTPAPVDSRHD